MAGLRCQTQFERSRIIQVVSKALEFRPNQWKKMTIKTAGRIGAHQEFTPRRASEAGPTRVTRSRMAPAHDRLPMRLRVVNRSAGIPA